jgi:hypothetical protein
MTEAVTSFTAPAVSLLPLFTASVTQGLTRVQLSAQPASFLTRQPTKTTQRQPNNTTQRVAQDVLRLR